MWRYLILIIFCLFISCKREIEDGNAIVVYKTSKDYSKNVFITLNSEKSKVTSFPAYTDIDTILPKRLSKDFYLCSGRNGITGINSVATLLTLFNYKSFIISDSLYKLVIDKDPFIEYYVCSNKSNISWFHNGEGIDTVKLNTAINNNELQKYFNRLK